nr:MAG TPA: hypothetical protein [Caudoviricetes sp.]
MSVIISKSLVVYTRYTTTLYSIQRRYHRCIYIEIYLIIFFNF